MKSRIVKKYEKFLNTKKPPYIIAEISGSWGKLSNAKNSKPINRCRN